MRKPIAALVIALGLWLGPGALAGDRGTHTRASDHRATLADETRMAVARYGVGARLTWLRGLSLALGVVTPTQPVFTTYGIIDEPDPTSRGDRRRPPGFGGSKGGSTSKDQTDDTAPAGPAGTIGLSLAAR